MLLPVPGSATSDGPTGYIDFTDPANPQFVEFPAHSFEYIDNPGFSGNPHIEEHLANSDVPMNEKYLGHHPMYAQSVVHDADGIRNWNPDDWNARGGTMFRNTKNYFVTLANKI